MCVAITHCFQLTGQQKYLPLSKNLPLYINEFRLLADFPIKTLPIVACFTEIALFLCINHELLKQLLVTFTKKTLKTGVIPSNFSLPFGIAVTLLLHYKVSTFAFGEFHVFYTTLIT
jgi:hypothetical protein